MAVPASAHGVCTNRSTFGRGSRSLTRPPPSQWMLPMLLAFFIVSGLFEHAPEKIAWVEPLAPIIVPAAVVVNVNFWIWTYTVKNKTYGALCFALYMAHMYAGTTDFFTELLPSTPEAHMDAMKVLVNHVGMFLVRRSRRPESGRSELTRAARRPCLCRRCSASLHACPRPRATKRSKRKRNSCASPLALARHAMMLFIASTGRGRGEGGACSSGGLQYLCAVHPQLCSVSERRPNMALCGCLQLSVAWSRVAVVIANTYCTYSKV